MLFRSCPIDMRDEIALDQAMDYYDAVVHSDINRADNVQKKPERVRRLMCSYAGNQGGQVSNTVITQDIAANDETPMSEETVAESAVFPYGIDGNRGLRISPP